MRLFQSAPPAFARGDRAQVFRLLLFSGFNPRPPLSRGAIEAESGRPGTVVVSIRAPRFREGRSNASPHGISLYCVSIRAPRFREGRSPFLDITAPSAWFQSAPPAFARGDKNLISTA